MMKDDEHGYGYGYDERRRTRSTTGSARRDNSRWSHLAKQQSPGQVMAGRGTWASVAQTVEHLTCNQEVVGSMPA